MSETDRKVTTTYVFRRNVEGETNWTDGKNCAASVVSVNGFPFVKITPKKPNRPWTKSRLLPMEALDHIEEIYGDVVAPEPFTVGVVSEAGPQKTRADFPDAPASTAKRGRSPKDALSE